MKNTNSQQRCTLRADLYTLEDGQYAKGISASTVFGEAVSTEEASDILEPLLDLKFQAMLADSPGTYEAELYDVRLSRA